VRRGDFERAVHLSFIQYSVDSRNIPGKILPSPSARVGIYS